MFLMELVPFSPRVSLNAFCFICIALFRERLRTASVQFRLATDDRRRHCRATKLEQGEHGRMRPYSPAQLVVNGKCLGCFGISAEKVAKSQGTCSHSTLGA